MDEGMRKVPATMLALKATPLLAGLVCGMTLLADFPVRVPNTTLQLPLQPAAQGYTTTNAFPGLTFNAPLAIVSPPNETNRLFVLEKAGQIQVITNLAAPNLTLFLDIQDQVNPMSEGGLLGLAFHPGWKTNRLFFVFYTLNTTTAAGNGFHERIARFQIDPDNPNRALPDSEVPLITQFDQAGNHNGGDLHFGPEGLLYVSLGDEGGAGDQYHNSKFIDRDFFCAILRLDVDHRPGSLPPNPHPAATTNYAIPPDNPFIGATEFNGLQIDPDAVRTEFWAVGLRNPWRFSFDPLTGWLYCGDVGQGAWEEIDIIHGGGNYGWNYLEGTHPYSGTPPAGISFIPPILEYSHSGSSTFRGNSVTGGVVYRGNRLSQLYGDYVFADYGSGNIWALHYDGTQTTRWRRLTSGNGIVAFGTDPSNGDILIAEIDTGRIARLIYNTTSTGSPLPPTLSQTGAFSDLTSLTPHPGIVPYDVNVPAWADGAHSSRWFSVPDTNQFLTFNATGAWFFPTGTVWIQHFDLEITNDMPESAKPIETRFLVRNADGVYGMSYRWTDDSSDAVLVPETGLEAAIPIFDGGVVRTQEWRFPSRSECLACHTASAGYALGFNALQLNRSHLFGNVVTNQILGFYRMGFSQESITNIANLKRLANLDARSATVQDRVRSYLAVNCAQCHQPAGTARGYWDARFTTPLAQANIIDGPLVDVQGDPSQRVVTPGIMETSMLLNRISRLGPGHMPPLATHMVNQPAIDLLTAWISSSLAPEYRPLRIEPNGAVGLDFTGIPNQTYRLEFTTNFTGWVSLGEASTDANGIGEAEDSEAGTVSGGRRFYRIRLP